MARSPIQKPSGSPGTASRRSSGRPTVVGALLFVVLGSACASIMGVEEPVLVNTLGNDGSVAPSPDASSSADAPSGGPCIVDKDCGGSLPHCVSGACVECSTTPGDTCPVGRYCLLPGNQCAVGCKANSDCASVSALVPFCDTKRHQCVACLDNTPCTDGKQCSPAGVCASRCAIGDAGACTSLQECCGDFCVDTKTDVFNCNGCGNACTGLSPVCCGGLCKDTLTNVDNCGGCGLQCSQANGTAECTAGSCKWSCAPGFSHCQTGNTGCETATSSVTMCGGCTTDCNLLVKNASGITCTSNTCNYAACSNQNFVDGDGNRANGCEPCGNADQACCPGNSPCKGGELYCGDDQKCHPCKVQNTVCGSTKECCDGKVCQSASGPKRCN